MTKAVRPPRFNVMDVKMVPTESVSPNLYNPNVMSRINEDLLITSIDSSGFCFPIIVINNDGKEIEDPKIKYIVVDGYHRFKVLNNHYKCPEIPVVVLDHDMGERMMATIRFNRSKGTHRIDGDANIVIELHKHGMSDEDICKNLGMSKEEVMRLKQSTGLKEAFANHEFSKSWEELKERLYKEKPTDL